MRGWSAGPGRAPGARRQPLRTTVTSSARTPSPTSSCRVAFRHATYGDPAVGARARRDLDPPADPRAQRAEDDRPLRSRCTWWDSTTMGGPVHVDRNGIPFWTSTTTSNGPGRGVGAGAGTPAVDAELAAAAQEPHPVDGPVGGLLSCAAQDGDLVAGRGERGRDALDVDSEPPPSGLRVSRQLQNRTRSGASAPGVPAALPRGHDRVLRCAGRPGAVPRLPIGSVRTRPESPLLRPVPSAPWTLRRTGVPGDAASLGRPVLGVPQGRPSRTSSTARRATRRRRSRPTGRWPGAAVRRGGPGYFADAFEARAARRTSCRRRRRRELCAARARARSAHGARGRTRCRSSTLRSTSPTEQRGRARRRAVAHGRRDGAGHASGGLVFLSYYRCGSGRGRSRDLAWHHSGGGARAADRYARRHGHRPKNDYGRSMFRHHGRRRRAVGWSSGAPVGFHRRGARPALPAALGSPSAGARRPRGAVLEPPSWSDGGAVTWLRPGASACSHPRRAHGRPFSSRRGASPRPTRSSTSPRTPSPSPALSLWDDQAFSASQNQAYGCLFPMGPFFALGTGGIEGWIPAGLVGLLLGRVRGVRLSRPVGCRRRLRSGPPGGVRAAPRVLSTLGPILGGAPWPRARAPWVLVSRPGARSPDVARGRARRSPCCSWAASTPSPPRSAPRPAPCDPLRRRVGPAAPVGLVAGCQALASAWFLLPLVLLGRYRRPSSTGRVLRRHHVGDRTVGMVLRGSPTHRLRTDGGGPQVVRRLVSGSASARSSDGPGRARRRPGSDPAGSNRRFLSCRSWSWWRSRPRTSGRGPWADGPPSCAARVARRALLRRCATSTSSTSACLPFALGAGGGGARRGVGVSRLADGAEVWAALARSVGCRASRSSSSLFAQSIPHQPARRPPTAPSGRCHTGSTPRMARVLVTRAARSSCRGRRSALPLGRPATSCCRPTPRRRGRSARGAPVVGRQHPRWTPWSNCSRPAAARSSRRTSRAGWASTTSSCATTLDYIWRRLVAALARAPDAHAVRRVRAGGVLAVLGGYAVEGALSDLWIDGAHLAVVEIYAVQAASGDHGA